MSFIKRLFRFVLEPIALLALLIGGSGGCGSKENNEKLVSPVQTVATLVEGADHTVTVKLVLISTAVTPHQFITTATNTRLRVPSGLEVQLTQTSPGHYTATSQTDTNLVYVGGQTYRFNFDLIDADLAKQVSGGNFVAVLTVPDDTVEASMSTPPEFAGDTAVLTWTPANRAAIIDVTNDESGQITYSTFDFTAPDFDGSKWARLKTGGSFQFGADVFSVAGNYTVRVCAVSKVSDFDKSLSKDLGVLSGFLAGRCPTPLIVNVGN
jgi:hypothetical protein